MRQALVAALLVGIVTQTPAQSLLYECRGIVSTENIFDGGNSEQRERQWRIITNYDAGYVKRDPELAAGCVERTVEVCGCELGPQMIRCRSLGLSPQGVEVAMDFSIDRATKRLKLTGRRVEPASGQVTETAGMLDCTESRIDPPVGGDNQFSLAYLDGALEPSCRQMATGRTRR